MKEEGRSHILPVAPHPEAVGNAPDTSMGVPCEDADAGAEADAEANAEVARQPS